MPDYLSSVKRFAFIITLLAIVAFCVVFTFDQLVVVGAKLTITRAQIWRTTETLMVVSFGLVVIFVIRRSKPLLSKYVGLHLALIFQFFMIMIVGIIVSFATLDIFEVSPTTLLVGGSIASIIIGLVISTFVGNILAGTLVLMTHPFGVGDAVMVNNVPGKVEEITTMVTRIRNDIGGVMVIPNTAIVQGGVIITSFSPSDTPVRGRLPYSLGDRVFTTYVNQEGVVKELTPFYTRILLDSGRELTFLNSSVFTGVVAVAKISKT